MLEMICRVPENIGWAIVGAISTLCVIMAIKLGKVFVEMWKEHHEEEEEEME